MWILKVLHWLSEHSHGFVQEIAEPKAFIGIFNDCCASNLHQLDDKYHQCKKCKRLFEVNQEYLKSIRNEQPKTEKV